MELTTCSFSLKLVFQQSQRGPNLPGQCNHRQYCLVKLKQEIHYISFDDDQTDLFVLDRKRINFLRNFTLDKHFGIVFGCASVNLGQKDVILVAHSDGFTFFIPVNGQWVMKKGESHKLVHVIFNLI